MRPRRNSPRMPHGSVQVGRSVTFLSEDSVHVRGTYVESPGERGLTAILVHDADADRRSWDPYLPLFRTRGWNVLTFDLRLPTWPRTASPFRLPAASPAPR